MSYKCVVCCCCFFGGKEGELIVKRTCHVSHPQPPHPRLFFYQIQSDTQGTSLTASSSWRFLSSSICMAIRRSFSRLCRSSTSLAASACTAKHSHSHHLPDICQCVVCTHLIHKHATVKFTKKRSIFLLVMPCWLITPFIQRYPNKVHLTGTCVGVARSISVIMFVQHMVKWGSSLVYTTYFAQVLLVA